jgi:DNA mismatch repair ATPase MutS
VDEVLLQYKARLHELEEDVGRARMRQGLAGAVSAIAFGLMVVFGLWAINQQMPWPWALAPIPVVIASARLYRKYRDARYRLWRLTCFCERAIQRVQGKWAGSGVSGEEFVRADHVYAQDLNVAGEGSLFELLCVAKTSIGRQGLAHYLLDAAAPEETLLRQEAVRELKDRVDLREKVATLGELESAESQWRTFEDWLNSGAFRFAKPLPVVAGITASALLVALIFVLVMGPLLWSRIEPWLILLVSFQAVIGLVYRTKVNRRHDLVRPVAAETPVLREGLRMLEEQEFHSVKLRHLVAQVRHASRSVRELEWLLLALNERHNPFFYAPSLLLLAGTQLCIAIEKWRNRHGAALRIWLKAWAEFEALNALAAYAYENPESTFPVFSNEPACMQARGLGHPLLPHDACVLNDVDLNQESRFYVLSGSNMSGKSTLLRAIGLNAVLAFAGAPVRAQALRLSSGLSVFASIAVVDSLLNGKSKFQAEVDRLRQTIEFALEDRPVLFLVDEIFSGTNSRDRRTAAEAIVRTLVGRGAIGVLSTHDLALTEIAGTDGLRGLNVHMGSRDGIDPMDFDYRLKPGVTQESNALAIARMSGVPV